MKIVNIKGTIIPKQDKWIYDWFEYPYTTTEDVLNSLQDANGDDVEVHINSHGGSVYDAYEIYTALRDYKGNVLIKIVGLAASAASFIAMAAKCLISPLAEIMIHNASTEARGPHQVMDATSQRLQVTDSTIAKAYVIKSGRSEEEIRGLMAKETSLSAEEAKELGLVDGIMFEENDNKQNIAPVIYNSLPIPSHKAIEQLRNCGSIEELKKRLTMNVEEFKKEVLMNHSTVINAVVDNKNKEEKKLMNKEELKNNYTELFNEVFNDGVNSERNRIKEIEDLAIPGNEDLVNKAKFETGATAEKLAVDIIKAEKARGTQYLNDLKNDINTSNLNNVKTNADPVVSNSKEEEDEAINFMANIANQRRGLK